MQRGNDFISQFLYCNDITTWTRFLTEIYKELHRPQFHFTARQNWINDPNGLVYKDGIWHLFFQHNIEATVWGKMWWGHAVSDDLLHWKQVDHALYPDETGTMFSGSAVVDHNDTAGFGASAILIFYTAAGMHADPIAPFTQCLAVSTDNGVSFTKFEENPIVNWIEADNRDPKVSWHEASEQWVMALYLDADRYCLLTSTDALNWQKIQNLELLGDRECPDFFPLTDDTGREHWVFSGACGNYVLGTFDGINFEPQTPVKRMEHGTNGYAAQTWSNSPDSRKIQISWMASGLYPEMPFNQQLSIPVELGLKGYGENLHITRWPIREVESLRRPSFKTDRQIISKATPFYPETNAKLFDVEFKLTKKDAQYFYVIVRGQPLVFNFIENELNFRPSGQFKGLEDRKASPLPVGEHLKVRLLIDVTSLEVFLNDGEFSASFCYLPDGHIHPLSLQAYSGNPVVTDFVLHEMNSIWE